MPAPRVRDRIAELAAQAERACGQRVLLRGVKSQDPALRGRVLQRTGHLLVEYRDDTAGYFWAEAIIERLLEAIIAGERDCALRDPQ